jgi:futalosine hydrolase
MDYEATPIARRLDDSRHETLGPYPSVIGRLGMFDVRVVVSGVGPALAAAATATAIAMAGRPDLAISLGIAGAFRGRGADPGVLCVADELIPADLTIPDGSGGSRVPNSVGRRLWTSPWFVQRAHNRASAVIGPILTLSTMTGTDLRAEELAIANPMAIGEAMEGVGVALAARRWGVPFGELRAISNWVGRYEPQVWTVPEVLERLSDGLTSILAEPWIDEGRRTRVTALLLTPNQKLLVIRRVRPAVPEYRILPGGGVDLEDADLECALVREVREETGEIPLGVRPVRVIETADNWGRATLDHLYAARIGAWSESDRAGPELDPGRGEYHLEEIDLAPDSVLRSNLLPATSAELIASQGLKLWDQPGSFAVLAEQVSYYDAIAGSFASHVEAAETKPLDAMATAFAELEGRIPVGSAIVEIACGPASWTRRLARIAGHITAIDSSPAMLAAARMRLDAPHVTFELADALAWVAGRKYDFACFAFWHSHVPPESVRSFWQTMRQALRPGGEVLFIDNAPGTLLGTTEETLDAATALRKPDGGVERRIVKVYYQPDELVELLRGLGWTAEVRQAHPLIWGWVRRTR